MSLDEKSPPFPSSCSLLFSVILTAPYSLFSLHDIFQYLNELSFRFNSYAVHMVPYSIHCLLHVLRVVDFSLLELLVGF